MRRIIKEIEIPLLLAKSSASKKRTLGNHVLSYTKGDKDYFFKKSGSGAQVEINGEIGPVDLYDLMMRQGAPTVIQNVLFTLDELMVAAGFNVTANTTVAQVAKSFGISLNEGGLDSMKKIFKKGSDYEQLYLNMLRLIMTKEIEFKNCFIWVRRRNFY